MDSAFISLMTDVSGTLRLDLQDPRWQQLLRCRKALHLTGNEAEFDEFYSRIILNNRISGNLHLLFELTSGKVNQLLQRRLTTKLSFIENSRPSSGNVEEQCCIGLHLISMLMCHFNSFLKPIEVSFAYISHSSTVNVLTEFPCDRSRLCWKYPTIGFHKTCYQMTHIKAILVVMFLYRSI